MCSLNCLISVRADTDTAIREIAQERDISIREVVAQAIALLDRWEEPADTEE